MGDPLEKAPPILQHHTASRSLSAKRACACLRHCFIQLQAKLLPNLARNSINSSALSLIPRIFMGSGGVPNSIFLVFPTEKFMELQMEIPRNQPPPRSAILGGWGFSLSLSLSLSISLHLLKSTAKNIHISSSDRFPLKPTDYVKIFSTQWKSLFLPPALLSAVLEGSALVEGSAEELHALHRRDVVPWLRLQQGAWLATQMRADMHEAAIRGVRPMG